MLCIVIPAYIEEKRIGKTLEKYGEFLKDLKKRKKIEDFELLVVLNGCTDNTLDVVKKFKKQFQEIRYLNFKEAGKGFAIIKGFRDAFTRNNELIGFVDADLATPPEAFYDLIRKIKDYHGVIASRGLKESRLDMSFVRKLTNRGFNFVVRSILFLPFSDSQCGAKLFRKQALEKVIDELGITKWAFDADLLYKLRRKRFKIKEIPTVWKDRKGSKLNLIKVPLLMFLSIVRLRILNSPFRGFIRLYDKMPEFIKIHHRLR